MWCLGDSQDGGVRYSQSPLEPVLVNMVPLDPEAPRGTGGGEAEVEGSRRPRRRTPAGPTKPATRLHSRGRLRTAHAMLLCPLSLPAGERKCVRSESGPPLRVFLTAAGALEKEWDGVGGAGVTPGSRTLVL